MRTVAPTVQTGIIVVGMHRSGTSATAGVLQMLGIELGRELLEPGPDNTGGYWELRSAVAINERLLQQLDRSWEDIRALPEGWMKSQAAKEAVESIEALVCREFADALVWAVKDPRISRLLPVWIEALSRTRTRPAVLLVARHPLDVAASIQSRNGWTAPVSEILWLRHLLEAEEASRGLDRTAITYESLLAEPAKEIVAALAKLGVVPTTTPAAVRDFIDVNARHHDESGKVGIESRLGAINGAAYDALKRIAAGGTDWGAIQAFAKSFRSEWLTWGAYVDSTAAMAAELRAKTNADSVRIAQIQSDLFAQIKWSDTAASRNESLQSELAKLQLALASKSVKKAVLADKIRELEADLAQSEYALSAQLRWSDEAVLRQEELHAECAGLRSDLTAQIQWSEEAALRQEELHAECARLRSELAARIDWTNTTVRNHEKREAERVRLRVEAEALTTANAELLGDLKVERRVNIEQAARHHELAVAYAARLNAAVQDHEKSEAERVRLQVEAEAMTTANAELSGDLKVESRVDIEQASDFPIIAEAHARLESMIEAMETDLDMTKIVLNRTAGELAVVLRSRSWRFTRYFRSLANMFAPPDGK